MPKASRVAVFWHTFPGGSQDEDEVKQTDISAPPLGLNIQRVPIPGPDEIQAAFAAMRKRMPGLLSSSRVASPIFAEARSWSLQLNRLPTMCEHPMETEEGCLLSYGNDPHYNWSRAATYVDKILKGTKPADIPVEQPMKFEFIINLKTAKQIGLTIPPSRCCTESGQGDQVILILLTRGTTARREVCRHQKQVGYTPSRHTTQEEEPPKPPPDEDESKPPVKEPPTEEPPVKEPPPKNRQSGLLIQ